jgi:5'-nucleotidase
MLSRLPRAFARQALLPGDSGRRPGRRSVGGAVLLLLASGPLVLAGGEEPKSDPVRLTLVASTASMGELKDCGCPEDPRGGLARRQWFVDSLRTRYGDLLLVDAGDHSHPQVARPGGLNGFMLKAMGELGYDAITLGEVELHRGPEFVRAILDSARVPVVLANVRFQSTGEPVGRPYVVCEAGGRSCAVTGVTGADLLDSRVAAAFTFEEPAAALRRILPEMNREADLTIVLAHLWPGAAMALAEEVPGVDVLVMGHSPGTVPPTRVGQVITVRPGDKGEYLAEVHLELAPGGEVIGFTGEAVMLEIATIPESPTMARQVDDLLRALGMAP